MRIEHPCAVLAYGLLLIFMPLSNAQFKNQWFLGDSGVVVLPRVIRPVLPSSCVPYGHFSGVEIIRVPENGPFIVLCDGKTAGPGWMVIQRHSDAKLSFSQSWNTYLQGFGAVDGDFFVGLNILHSLTNYHRHELYVQFEHSNGERTFAKYDDFEIGNESENFKIKSLGAFSGNATDFMKYHENQMFSTFDRDNDNYEAKNCAKDWGGGFWFNDCAYVNPNGWYHLPGHTFEGIWWTDHSSVLSVQMMIRPKYNY